MTDPTAVLAWGGFLLAALVALLNLYLAFLRVPLLRRRGIPPEEIRFVSGFPVVGNLLVAGGLLRLHGDPAGLAAGFALLVADPGGLPWFLAILLRRFLRGEPI